MMTRTLLAGVAATTVAVSAQAGVIAGTSGYISRDITAGDLTAAGNIGANGDQAALDNLVDGNGATFGDSWAGGALGGTHNALGVTDVAISAGMAVDSLEIDLTLFQDGGWFGVNGANPGAGNALAAGTHLNVAPQVQVSSDNGATWSAIASTSDYLSVLTGQTIGGGANPNPNPVTVTFDFAGQTGINAIRVVGETGGNAGGDTNGFVGATEIRVIENVPEPSSLALLGLGGLLVARRRRG